MSSGVPFGTPPDKYPPCLSEHRGSSRKLSEPLGASWSFSEPSGVSRSLIPTGASRSFSEPFGTFSEPLTYQVAYPLVGHLISTCLACFTSGWMSSPRTKHFAEFSQAERSEAPPPGRAKRGVAPEPREGFKQKLICDQTGSEQARSESTPCVGGKACSARTGY